MLRGYVVVPLERIATPRTLFMVMRERRCLEWILLTYCITVKKESMKRILLVAMLLTFALSGIFAQKIKTKEIDKFTKSEIIETSLETLFQVNYGSGWTHRFNITLRRVNGSFVMPTYILLPDMVKYTEGDGVILLLDNGETLFLETLYTGISSRNSTNTGYGFSTVFELSQEEIELLKHNKVTDIRVRYFGGSYDKEIKNKKQTLIIDMLRLFDNL